MRKKTNLKKENGKKEKLRFPSNTSLIFFFLRGSMLYFFAGAVFACLVAFFDLIIPRLIQYTVDAVIGGDLSAVPGWAAGIIVRLGGRSLSAPAFVACCRGSCRCRTGGGIEPVRIQGEQ